jgi:hypothetical protein
MGSTAKKVAGVVAIFFAPVLAPALLGSIGVAASATAVAVASAGIVLVGASLVGSAMAESTASQTSAVDTVSVESYAGAKLQTIKSNTAPVPIIYGKHRIAGNIVWQHTSSALNSDNTTNGYNRDYWCVIVLAGHELEDINYIYAGEDQMNSLGSDKYETEYVHIKFYNRSASARDIRTIDWCTSTGGNEDTGAVYGLPSGITIPADTAILCVHQVFDADDNKNTALAAITAEVEGKKIRTITDASTISTATTYTTNPAEILLDLLTTGLSVADADIDIATFYSAKTDCNSNSWSCDLALIQQANIQSHIADVLATCRGKIFHSESKWKCKIDTKSQSVADTLTSDDVIGNSLSITMAGSSTIANKVIVKYINPSDEWLSAESVKEDSTLQTYDGQTVQKILDIKGVTSATHAAELSEIALNSLRYSEDGSANRVKQTPLAITFATSVKNAHLEVGDVISLNHTLLDRVRQFLLLSTMTDQSGVIQISAREYCETHFKDTSGSYLI